MSSDSGPDVMAAMYELHEAIGSPSPAVLRVHLDLHGLPRATAYDLLKPGKVTRPSWATVEAFVSACWDYARKKRIVLQPEWEDIEWWDNRYEEHRASVTVRLTTADVQLRGAWRPNDAERKAAWELYVELATRVALVPLPDDVGLDREALTSLHQLFGIHREVLRRYGPELAEPRADGGYNLGYLALTALNRVVRPFLSTWHPLLEEAEAQRPAGVSVVAHERAWDQHLEFRRALDNVRADLGEYARWLASASGIQDLTAALPEPDQPSAG